MKMDSRWGQAMRFAVVAVVTVALVAGKALADETNPYSVIVDRNIFHLNPPPPPPKLEDSKPIELPKVMLTGFMGKGASEEVFFAIPSKDGKAPPTFLSLKPGQKGGENGVSVELLRINLHERSVDIVNSGTAQTLTVKSNAYVSSGGGGPSPNKGPGAPGAPGGPPGIHRGPPGFSLPTVPQAQGRGHAEAEPSSGGAIVAGGGSSSSGAGYASTGSGALVSGGSAGAPISEGNGIANAVAQALVNPATGHYQMPTPTAPPVPVTVQAAGMVTQKAMMGGGGPPLPPVVQEAVDNLEGGGPPQVP